MEMRWIWQFSKTVFGPWRSITAKNRNSFFQTDDSSALFQKRIKNMAIAGSTLNYEISK